MKPMRDGMRRRARLTMGAGKRATKKGNSRGQPGTLHPSLVSRHGLAHLHTGRQHAAKRCRSTSVGCRRRTATQARRARVLHMLWRRDRRSDLERSTGGIAHHARLVHHVIARIKVLAFLSRQAMCRETALAERPSLFRRQSAVFLKDDFFFLGEGREVDLVLHEPHEPAGRVRAEKWRWGRRMAGRDEKGGAENETARVSFTAVPPLVTLQRNSSFKADLGLQRAANPSFTTRICPGRSKPAPPSPYALAYLARGTTPILPPCADGAKPRSRR